MENIKRKKIVDLLIDEGLTQLVDGFTNEITDLNREQIEKIADKIIEILEA